MIYLHSGLPGSGKTLRAITLGLERVAQGREVYALNINGLDHDVTGIKPWMKGLDAWQELPTGAVLIVDECQSILKPRGPGATPPDWIEALTRNRHLGIDLHLVTQDPMLMDSYVRRLVNYHEHLIRMDGGFNRARIYSAEHCMDVGKGKIPEGSEYRMWAYPEQNFALYKSADAHTVRRRIPQSFVVVALGLLVLVIAAGVVWSIMDDFGQGDESAESAGSGHEVPRPAPAPQRKPLGLGLGQPYQRAPMTVEEYITATTPRIQGHPWSAPIYDGQKPVAQPRIACMSTRTDCRCMSEQATPIKLVDPMCRAIARDGVYNPFLRVEPVRPGAKPDMARDQESSAVASSDATDPAPYIGTDYRPPGLERGPTHGATDQPSGTP